MSQDPLDDNQRDTGGILRRGEQVLIACAVGSALVLLALYWIVRTANQDRLIDIDDAPRRHAVFKVDINKAEWPELIQLPEVGEATARRIVAERNRGGPSLLVRHPPCEFEGDSPIFLRKIGTVPGHVVHAIR